MKKAEIKNGTTCFRKTCDSNKNGTHCEHSADFCSMCYKRVINK